MISRMKFLKAMPSELDLEILPFAAYELIIDARTPAEFAEDHIPGAINLPTLSAEEYESVGDMVRSEPTRAHAAAVSAGMRRVEGHIGRLAGPVRNALVYCSRGGKRSRIWAGALRGMDVPVKVLPGGWKSYRRWVTASLDLVAKSFEYRVIAGPAGSGQEQMLAALRAEGAQVLDLGMIGSRRGRPLSMLDPSTQPRQSLFESLLLDAMRKFDTASEVWVSNWLQRVGMLKVPTVLRDELKQATVVELTAPMHERIDVLRSVHGVPGNELAGLVEQVAEYVDAGAKVEGWKAEAISGNFDLLTERMLREYFDPQYFTHRKSFAQIDEAQSLELGQIGAQGMRRMARMLMADFPKRAMPLRSVS